MIRGFFRMVGLLLLAAAFIFLVYDGARSIADQMLRLTRLGEFWNDIHQSSQLALRTRVDELPVVAKAMHLLLDQPVWAIMGVIGIFLLMIFRPRKPLIGYSR